MPVLVTVAPPMGESFVEVESAAWFREWWDASRPGWVDPSWWSMPVRSDVAVVLDLAAGPGLLAALVGLRARNCEADHNGEGMTGAPVPGTAPGSPCGCQVVLIAAWRAVASWAAVQSAAALVDAVGAEVVVLPDDGVKPGIVDPAREEVAVAMRTSANSASGAIGRARDLAAFPDAASLAAEGLLPLRTVERVCEEVRRLGQGDAVSVMAKWCSRVRSRAAGRSPMTGQAAMRSARRLIIAAASYLAARKKARASRRVELWQGPDGTATLAAVLPEEVALRIHRRLTAMARGLADPQDDRGIDARRADLLADLLLGAATSVSTGVEINVIIPVESLLGLADGLAEIPGLGPVPAATARALAAQASWRAWLTRADGTVVRTSTDTYRPTAGMARLIAAREPACRMAGCSRPAAQCDLDHAIPWPRGQSSLANLGPLCRRHHVMKTHYDWDLIPEQEVWRTPAGAEVPFSSSVTIQ